jgi:hypothetical protein
MPQAGACVLAALKRARDDQVKELNATISIVGELVDAIAMVESQRKKPAGEASRQAVNRQTSFPPDPRIHENDKSPHLFPHRYSGSL